MPHIIVVGGGFVGLPAVKRIARLCGKDATVTLIDPNEHFTFLPRLTDALEGGADASHVLAPYAPLAAKHGFTYVRGTVDRIDRDARKFSYVDADGKTCEAGYDCLVYAPGSVTNYYGTPGAEEHCLTLKSWDDVSRLHARIDLLIDEARTVPDDRKKVLLSLVVVGAGPTGTEAVFALRRYLTKKIKERAPELAPHASFALIQAAPQILPGFHPAIVDGTAVELHKKGITLFVGEPVIRVEAERVETAHKRSLPAGLILWAAGIKRRVVPLIPAAAEDPGHYVMVDRDLTVGPHIFGGGDAVSYKEKQLTVPKNGQTAYLMSARVAENAVRALRGHALKPFRYSSRGAFLPLGDTGFIQAGPFVLKSKLAKLVRDHYYGKIHRDIST